MGFYSMEKYCFSAGKSRPGYTQPHCGEPLPVNDSEAADALASAAAEVDGAPMTGESHLDPWAVHFFIGHDGPVKWGLLVRNQVAAKWVEPGKRRDGDDWCRRLQPGSMGIFCLP